MMSVSGKLTPHALTSTSAWPADTAGDGTSSRTNFSGSPKVLQTTAFMPRTISIHGIAADVVGGAEFAIGAGRDDERVVRRVRAGAAERERGAPIVDERPRQIAADQHAHRARTLVGVVDAIVDEHLLQVV